MSRNTRSRLRNRSTLSFFVRDFCRDVRGTPAIEFGLIAPILGLLLLGVADFGRGYWDQLQVTGAAQAGASYAVNSGFSATGVANAVTNGSTTITATPVPTQFCGCPNVTAGVTSSAGTPPTCTGTCTGGGTAGVYTTVNAQLSFTTIFPWPGLPRPTLLQATTTARLQ
jgi:Flp pilus assembly protein TadG